MSCKHCELKPRRSGKLEWEEGEDFETFGSEHYATIERDSRGVVTLSITHPDADDYYMVFGYVPIRHCPWCGEDMMGGEQ